MTVHLLLALFIYTLLLGTANSDSHTWNASNQQRLVLFSGGANISKTSEKSVDLQKNSSSNTTLQAVDAISQRQPSLLHSDGASKEHKHSCSRSWFYPKDSSNGSTVCECGSPVGYTVQCPTESQALQVLVCYCMTYNKETASFVVGMCFYACFFGNTYYTIPKRVNATNLNAFLCNGHLHFHRDGQLCGACEDGYALPV